MATPSRFPGFETPRENWSKLPNELISNLNIIDSLAEIKCILYILRHTWGFKEYGKAKHITTDEFMNGRKRKNGTRMDKGTGLVSNNSIINGLERAVEHGFLIVEKDDSDLARIEKSYKLNIMDEENSDVQIMHSQPQNLHSQPQNLHSYYAESAQRSEKETKETNLDQSNHTVLWSKILSPLRGMFKKNQYYTWIEPAQAVCFNGNTLTVRMSNDVGREWMEENVKEFAESFLQVSIEFVSSSSQEKRV